MKTLPQCFHANRACFFTDMVTTRNTIGHSSHVYPFRDLPPSYKKGVKRDPIAWRSLPFPYRRGSLPGGGFSAGRGERSAGLGVVRSLLQAVNCGLMVNSCPHHSYADRSTKAFPDRRTTRAERADPSGNADRCSSEGVRAADPVHPVSVFALCL